MKTKLPKLLVVDDDEDFCTIISNKLADLFAIRSVANLAAAIELLETYNPEIMLLDNYLPDGLGARFVKICKQTNPSVRVIMVSADADPELKRETLEAGAALFLSKPFDIETLRTSLQEVLGSTMS